MTRQADTGRSPRPDQRRNRSGRQECGSITLQRDNVRMSVLCSDDLRRLFATPSPIASLTRPNFSGDFVKTKQKKRCVAKART